MPGGGRIHTVPCLQFLYQTLWPLGVFIIVVVSRVMGVLCIVETPGRLMLSDHRNSIGLASHTQTHVCAHQVSGVSSEVGARSNGPTGALTPRCSADVYHSCQLSVWTFGEKRMPLPAGPTGRNRPAFLCCSSFGLHLSNRSPDILHSLLLMLNIHNSMMSMN